MGILFERTAGLISIGLVIVVAVILGGTAIAAETGRVTLDGREIILHDDKTWEYSAGTGDTQTGTNNNCVPFNSKTLPVSICLDEGYWYLGNEGGAAEFSFSSNDEKLYLLMITEKDVIPLDKFEKAIITNAQKAAGLKPVKVDIKERINAFGLEWGRMVYTANIDGLIIKYENFFTTMKGKGSVQFVFYATPENHGKTEAEIEKAIKKIDVKK